jgi:hypothetical protein
MPSEVFIHYLQHGEGDLHPSRNDWLPHLPKRVNKDDAACDAYGMHIIEGPHKLGIFVMMVFVVICTIIVSAVYSSRTLDVQGGTGIGALVIACFTAVLTA